LVVAAVVALDLVCRLERVKRLERVGCVPAVVVALVVGAFVVGAGVALVVALDLVCLLDRVGRVFPGCRVLRVGLLDCVFGG